MKSIFGSLGCRRKVYNGIFEVGEVIDKVEPGLDIIGNFSDFKIVGNFRRKGTRTQMV